MATQAAAEQPVAETLARSRVIGLEWLRRDLVLRGHLAGDVLGEVLADVGSAPNAQALLAHPWTERWLATAVRLVDRGALEILPEGQVAAHLGLAVNLLAALRIGREPVTVRFDEHGAAWLPGTGAVAQAPLVRAGRAGHFGVLDGGVADGQAVRWPEVASCVELEGDATNPSLLVEEPTWVDNRSAAEPGCDRSTASDAVSHQYVEPISLTERARELIDRWADGGGSRMSPTIDVIEPPTSTVLVDFLTQMRIPVSIEPNQLGADRIRQDASFDHLSLLSVREPGRFAEIEDIASRGTDILSRRVGAHVAYIRRRYLEAAAIYADLLAGRAGDTDTWRDLCWSLRHAGREEVVRVWVLHPYEVVQVAEAVNWMIPAAWPQSNMAGMPGSSSLELIVDLLEWIAHDLRAR